MTATELHTHVEGCPVCASALRRQRALIEGWLHHGGRIPPLIPAWLCMTGRALFLRAVEADLRAERSRARA